MSKATLILTFVCTLFLAQESNAQQESGQQYTDVMWGIADANYGTFDGNIPDDQAKALNHIRRERFRFILPRVMREGGIDMWIHVIRPWSWGGTDPLRYEFGSKSAVLIFTDRGGDQIERAVFQGTVQDPGAYDIVRGRSRYMSQENYEMMDYAIEYPDNDLKTELGLRFLELEDFVAERDPKRIAVNYMESLSFPEGSETFTMALTDGISYTDYLQLSKALGDKYAKRMVSAEHLILDYLSRRVAGEVVLNGSLAYGRRRDQEFEIVPGVTTLSDIGGGSVLSEVGDAIRADDYVIQRGDYVFQGGDLSLGWQKSAYVLRDGETDLPWYIRKFWEDDKKVREILRKNIKVGLTAGETCDLLARKLEEAGFVYTEYQEFNKNVDHPERMQVHLDMHAEGKGILAPRISPMGPKWHWNVKIPLFHTFAVEYMTYMYVPEWDREKDFTGQILNADYHDGAVVSGRGMEFVYPDQPDKIKIIP